MNYLAGKSSIRILKGDYVGSIYTSVMYIAKTVISNEGPQQLFTTVNTD